MQKKLIIGGVVILLIVLGFFVWRSFFSGNSSSNSGSNTSQSSQPSSGQEVAHVASPQTAYEIALARAKTWNASAVPQKIILGDTTGNDWTFLFVSPTAKGEGFQIVVSGQAILSASPVPSVGSGIALPQNAISPDNAIALAHAVPGYGSATFTSIEMIYNTAAKQWYWGIKMSTGSTITIKATP